MSDGKYAYFVCVDGTANSNKFYEMKQINDREFRATWGREDSNRMPGSKIYSMHQWRSVYNKRVNKSRSKPYTDVTHLKRVEIVAEDASQNNFVGGIASTAVRDLIVKLQGFATGSVRRNYKISSQNVTQAMVDEAQDILSQMAGLLYSPDINVSNRDINRMLEDLYTVVPRRMTKVADHMLPYTSDIDSDAARKLFQLEMDNIDVMAQQVRAHSRNVNTVKDDNTTSSSILDSMGLTIRRATADEARYVRSLTKRNANRIGTVFAVENQHTQSAYDTKIATASKLGHPHDRIASYWHGSRNENWLSILDRGLLIRPPNAASTGDMFGIGIYFADRFQKSLGYTSVRGSYYARGSSNTGFLAVYNVHIGKQYEVGRHSYSHYNLSAAKLRRLGNYDSTWGKSGPSLVNNEYIVYSPDQCTVAYLVQIK